MDDYTIIKGGVTSTFHIPRLKLNSENKNAAPSRRAFTASESAQALLIKKFLNEDNKTSSSGAVGRRNQGAGGNAGGRLSTTYQQPVVPASHRSRSSSSKQQQQQQQQPWSDVEDDPVLDELEESPRRTDRSYTSNGRAKSARSTHTSFVAPTASETLKNQSLIQRVEPPLYMNAPSRGTTNSLKLTASSVISGRSPTPGMGSTSRMSLNRPATSISSSASRPESRSENISGASLRNSLRDSQMLSSACRRAGKTRMESQSYYRMGVVHDNKGDLESAISCYKKYLVACRRIHDSTGEALAFNHLGVNYQLLGRDYFQKAIACHVKHRDIADIAGKFIAHSNLGLLYKESGDNSRAVLNFRHALRYAIHLNNIDGERFAYQQLGEVTDDYSTAMQCLQRQLQLSESINDVEAAQHAYTQMGKLASTAGDYSTAQKYLTHTLQSPRAHGTVDNTQAKVELGIAVAQSRLQETFHQTALSLSMDDY